MAKESVFTMKLEPELRDAFMAEAKADHRPASQVVRELMREYVRRRQEERVYDAFLEDKVSAARESVRTGRGRSNASLEAEFAKRRKDLAS